MCVGKVMGEMEAGIIGKERRSEMIGRIYVGGLKMNAGERMRDEIQGRSRESDAEVRRK